MKKQNNGLKTYPRTDLGNAEIFAHKNKGKLVYDHSQKQWFYWNGSIWKPDMDGEVYRIAKKIIRSRANLSDRIEDKEEKSKELEWAYRSESGNKIDMMLKRASTEKEIAISGETWDKHLNLLGTPSGVVDLENGKLITPDSSLYISLLTNIPYSLSSKKPERWLKFINEMWPNDEEMQNYIHKVLGYSLTGYTREQCYFAFYGLGSNGKGILAKVLQLILGSYYQTIKFTALELRGRLGISNDIVECSGKRIVFASEINDACRLNEGLIKSITGEDHIQARQLYERNRGFLPHLKLFLSFNHKPVIKDITPGFWRRFRLINLPVCYSTNYGLDELPLPDLNLLEKLKQELPEILNWLVQGCMKWMQEGLKPPNIVLVDTKEYQKESHPLHDFIDHYFDICLTDEDYKELRQVVFDRYLSDCITYKDKPLKQSEFNKLMEGLGFKKVLFGKKRERGWKGLKFKEGEDGFELNKRDSPLIM